MAVKYHDSQGKPVILGNEIGSGGEATVYCVDARPELLAKIFKKPDNTNYIAKLSWMMAHPPANPSSEDSQPALAWPQEILTGPNRLLAGYLMRRIQGSVTMLNVTSPRLRSKVLPGFNRRYLHRTARNLAAALEALHMSGYVVGDVNESNILVSPRALVTLIDTDSFQVQADPNGRLALYPCKVGRPEYLPPELYARPLDEVVRLPEHDAFTLGVLIFQLLMDGNHPFRAQWLAGGEPLELAEKIRRGYFPYAVRPSGPVKPPRGVQPLSNLHPMLVQLFMACFVDGQKDARSRPSASQWRQALVEAEQSLQECARGHCFSAHLGGCPACPPSERGKPAARPSQQPHSSRPVQSPAANRTSAGQAGSTRQTSNTRQPGSTGQNGFTKQPGFTRQPAPTPAGQSQTAHTGQTGPSRASGSQVPPGFAAAASNSATNNRGATAARMASAAIRSAIAMRNASTPASPAATMVKVATAALRAAAVPNPNLSNTGPVSPQPPRPPAASPQPSGMSAGAATAAQPSSPFAGGFGGSARPRPRPSSRSGARPYPNIRTRHADPITQVILRSFAVGGPTGLLAGILAGAIICTTGWAFGHTPPWYLMWAGGGAAAGYARSWKPSYRLGIWVRVYIGWERFWKAAGLVMGVLIGGAMGLVWFWLVFPLLFGLVGGGFLGYKAGEKIYLAGQRYGWERIWAIAGATATAIVGSLTAGLIGAGMLGRWPNQQAELLGVWLAGKGVAWFIVWAAAGGLVGSIGGAVSGVLSDLIARLAGLAD